MKIWKLILFLCLTPAMKAQAKQPFCAGNNPLYLKDEVLGFSQAYGQWALKRTQALCQADGSSAEESMQQLKTITYYEIYNRVLELKSRYFGGGMTSASYQSFLDAGGQALTWAVAAEAPEMLSEEKFQNHFKAGRFRAMKASTTDPNAGRCSLEMLEVIWDPRVHALQLMMIGKRKKSGSASKLSSEPSRAVFLRRTPELPVLGSLFTFHSYWEKLEAKYLGNRAPSIFLTYERTVTVDGISYPSNFFDIISDHESARDSANITDRVFECVYR